MKTTFLIATSLFFSSILSAQQAHVKGEVEAKAETKAATSAATNTSKAAASHISETKAEIGNKTSPNTSVEGNWDNSTKVSASGPVSVSRPTVNAVEIKANKSASVSSNSKASLNTNIRPASLKTSSAIATGTQVRF